MKSSQKKKEAIQKVQKLLQLKRLDLLRMNRLLNSWDEYNSVMRYLQPVPYNTSSETGAKYVSDTINKHTNYHKVHDRCRMSRKAFLKLSRYMREKHLLEDTATVSVEEQLMIFIHIVKGPAITKDAVHCFQHSSQTINKYFHLVLAALIGLFGDVVTMPSSDTPLHRRISRDPKFFPYFENCLGAIDGTIIRSAVPEESSVNYIGRKGKPAQNVFAACDFDRKFVYVASGYEGAAADSTVFRDVVSKGFKTPPGKFWLGDAAYSNSGVVLAPYRNTAYHLDEKLRSKVKPKTAKELFNLRHASLRSIIERTFALYKRKFPAMDYVRLKRLDDQAKLVLACAALHNWILIHDKTDPDRKKSRDEEVESDIGDSVDIESEEKEAKEMENLRDRIAQEMWDDYQAYLNNQSIEGHG